MRSLSQTVRALLDRTGARVWYFYPQSWLNLPAIAYRESGSRQWAQADGREHLTELTYSVDVWAKSPAEAKELADRANDALTSAGFRRDYAEDLYDDGLYRCALRYRCLSDGRGGMYQ